MSGGSLNYFYSHLEEHVGDFEDKELDELVKDLAELFHDREWYLSADTGIGSWREARSGTSGSAEQGVVPPVYQ